jgi:hypothetical protein
MGKGSTGPGLFRFRCPGAFGLRNHPRFPQYAAHELEQRTVPAANASLPEFGTGQPENGPKFVV